MNVPVYSVSVSVQYACVRAAHPADTVAILFADKPQVEIGIPADAGAPKM